MSSYIMWLLFIIFKIKYNIVPMFARPQLNLYAASLKTQRCLYDVIIGNSNELSQKIYFVPI
jgi:hypothetical protein